MAPKTCRIIRKSIFTLLQNYQYFTSTPTLLAFPYAASYLLTQSLVTSSRLFPLVDGRLRSLFLAAGFPPSSRLFATLNLKLSQTVTTFLFISPFTFTFLLLARASVITRHRKPTLSYRSPSLFSPLLITQLCNSLVVLAANATCFFFFALCFNYLDALGLPSSQGTVLFLSAASALIYYIVVANAYIICNLASVSSGMESRGGLISILKACVMIQGRTRSATALSLAVAMNSGLAAIEALFAYRVVRGYPNSGLLIIMEGVLIAFLYAMFLVLDTIVGCVFWRSCKKYEHTDHQHEIYFHQIEMAEKDLDMNP